MHVLVTSTKLVADTVAVSRVAVATVIMMQELQRSVLVLVVPVLAADTVVVVEAGVDMLVVPNEVEAVDDTEVEAVVVVDAFHRDNQATNNICLPHQRRMVK